MKSKYSIFKRTKKSQSTLTFKTRDSGHEPDTNPIATKKYELTRVNLQAL
jgi:hypothetical protein